MKIREHRFDSDCLHHKAGCGSSILPLSTIERIRFDSESRLGVPDMIAETAEHLVNNVFVASERDGRCVVRITVAPEVYAALLGSTQFDSESMTMWGASVGMSEDPGIPYVRLDEAEDPLPR